MLYSLLIVMPTQSSIAVSGLAQHSGERERFVCHQFLLPGLENPDSCMPKTSAINPLCDITSTVKSF